MTVHECKYRRCAKCAVQTSVKCVVAKVDISVQTLRTCEKTCSSSNTYDLTEFVIYLLLC
jgi:hypothetical protein